MDWLYEWEEGGTAFTSGKVRKDGLLLRVERWMDCMVWSREGSFYPVIVEGSGLRSKVLYRRCLSD